MNWTPIKWLLLKKKLMCILVHWDKIICSDPAKLQKYERDPPSCPSIRLWHEKFMETGTLFDTRRSGRPRTSEENIKLVRQPFQRYPMKSICTAARQLELPCSTVHRVSSILTSVVSLGLNIWFCLNELGYTLCFFLSSHFMGVQFM